MQKSSERKTRETAAVFFLADGAKTPTVNCVRVAPVRDSSKSPVTASQM